MKPTNHFTEKLLLLAKIILFYCVMEYVLPLAAVCFTDFCRWLANTIPACSDITNGFLQLDYGRFSRRVSTFIATLIIYFAFIKFFDGETIKQSVLNPSTSKLKFFIYGAALGTFVTGTTIWLIMITNAATLYPNPYWMSALIPTIFLYLIAMTMTATKEELIYRGYILHNLFKTMNPHAAIFLTAFLFGYGHFQYSYLYAIMTFIFGLIAGYGFLWTANLYFCIGFHFAGNVFESVFFSRYLSTVVVNNHFLAGDRNITPDREGFLSLPALIIGLMILVTIRNIAVRKKAVKSR